MGCSRGGGGLGGSDESGSGKDVVQVERCLAGQAEGGLGAGVEGVVDGGQETRRWRRAVSSGQTRELGSTGGRG